MQPQKFIIKIFSLPIDQQEDKAVLYALCILAIGVGTFICLFLQVSSDSILFSFKFAINF